MSKIKLVNDNMNELLELSEIEQPTVPVPTPLPSNQKTRTGRGGPRPNSGRKKGAVQKLSAVELLDAIHKATGKSFAENIADHYYYAILTQQWHDVRDYEKFLTNKVVSEVQQVDITTNGESLKANFAFVPVELQDWKKPE